MRRSRMFTLGRLVVQVALADDGVWWMTSRGGDRVNHWLAVMHVVDGECAAPDIYRAVIGPLSLGAGWARR